MIVDWSQEWKQYRESSHWTQKLKQKGITSEQFWDGYKMADRNEEYDRLAGYPGLILDRMLRFAGPDSSVLDIGAGAGAYTIPLAKAARKVTVVEPSRGQIARLMRRADREGLENIEVINKRWQDVIDAELESYSLVNAAYCFHMPDIRPALQKMLDVTTGALFLVALVDHGFTTSTKGSSVRRNPSQSTSTSTTFCTRWGILQTSRSWLAATRFRWRCSWRSSAAATTSRRSWRGG